MNVVCAVLQTAFCASRHKRTGERPAERRTPHSNLPYYKDIRVFQPALKLRGTIETTGAGDTFCACVLDYVLDQDLSSLTDKNLHEMLAFANAAAGLVTTRKGALRVMPSKAEVERLLG